MRTPLRGLLLPGSISCSLSSMTETERMGVAEFSYREQCTCRACLEVRNSRGGPTKPLLRAVAEGNTDLAIALLQTTRCRVDERDKTEQSTPLFYAAARGYLQVCQLLLQAGADPNASNNGQVTPLHACIDHGRLDIARLLLYSGADINAQTENGDTPAHNAILRKNDGALALLLAHGADPTIVNSKGKNLTQAAHAAANTEAIKMLNTRDSELLQYETTLVKCHAAQPAPTSRVSPPAFSCPQHPAKAHATPASSHPPLIVRHNTGIPVAQRPISPTVTSMAGPRTIKGYNNHSSQSPLISFSHVTDEGPWVFAPSSQPTHSPQFDNLPPSLLSYFQSGSRTPVESDCEVLKSLNEQSMENTSEKYTAPSRAGELIAEVAAHCPGLPAAQKRPPSCQGKSTSSNIPADIRIWDPSKELNTVQFSANSPDMAIPSETCGVSVATKRPIKIAQRRSGQPRAKSAASPNNRISTPRDEENSHPSSAGLFARNITAVTNVAKDSCHTKNLCMLATGF